MTGACVKCILKPLTKNTLQFSQTNTEDVEILKPQPPVSDVLVAYTDQDFIYIYANYTRSE